MMASQAEDSTDYWLILVAIVIVISLVVISFFLLRKEKETWRNRARDLYEEALSSFEDYHYENSKLLFGEAMNSFRKGGDFEMVEECQSYINQCDKILEEIRHITRELETEIRKIKNYSMKIRSFFPQCEAHSIPNVLLNPDEVGELFSEEKIDDTDFVKRILGSIDYPEGKNIKMDLMRTRDVSEQLEREVAIMEKCHALYLKHREILCENLVDEMNVETVAGLCDVDHEDARYLLNFLIAEYGDGPFHFEWGKVIQHREERPPEFEEVQSQEMETIQLEETHQKKEDVILQYLREVDGIERIETLRDYVYVDDEEMRDLLIHIMETENEGDMRYYVDWYNEKVFVDYYSLLRYVQKESEEGKSVADIIREKVNKCKIPRDVQLRLSRE